MTGKAKSVIGLGMFRGYAEPRYLTTFTPGIDLFNARLRIQSLFDWRGGNTYYNQTERIRCTRPNCNGLFNPKASFQEQAMVVAAIYSPEKTLDGYYPARRVREMARALGHARAAASRCSRSSARATRASCSPAATCTCGRSIAERIRRATSRRRAAATRRASSRRSRRRRSTNSVSTSASDLSTTTDMRLLLNSGRAVATTLALTVAAGLAACDTVKTNLLEAATRPSSIRRQCSRPAGATAVRNGALARLRAATADGESSWMFGGLLADEWATSSTFVQNQETDQRSIQLNNGTVNSVLRALYRVRTAANQAIVLLKKYKPTPAADIAEMYFARGFAEFQLASDFCNGIPLSDGAGDQITFGKPLPVKDVFTVAIASFDTAMSMASGTDARASRSIARHESARRGRCSASGCPTRRRRGARDRDSDDVPI